MSSVEENQVAQAFEETTSQIDTTLNELMEVKYRLEKAHFSLLMAIEPKLSSEVELKWPINCEACQTSPERTWYIFGLKFALVDNNKNKCNFWSISKYRLLTINMYVFKWGAWKSEIYLSWPLTGHYRKGSLILEDLTHICIDIRERGEEACDKLRLRIKKKINY